MSSENTSQETQDTLPCLEKMDRASPDLWPDDEMEGILMSELKSSGQSSPAKPNLKDLEEDISMLDEFSSLTTASLMEKVKALQNLAFQLGLDEGREMTRGKFLKILPTKTKNK